jgi:signal transduction histidine kinase
VDVGALAHESAGLLAADPALAGTRVTIEGSAQVLADADMLRRVFTNLVLNAAHAMEGKGHVGVSVDETETDVVVRVADDGPGIPADMRERIFEPFVTTKSRGTGLGLPLARRHVEAHGGSLELADTVRGATFVIRLPRRKLTG